MIAHADLIAAPSRTNRLWHDWKYIFAGLAFFLPSLGFYLNSQANSASDEIVRVEPLEPQGLLGEQTNWLAVKVFDPATGEWRETTKGEVVPGEEFVAMDRLFKEYIYGWMPETHGEIDVKRLADAYRAFDPKDARRPTGDDVVYVFGQKLPRIGFQVLALVGSGETFRFQGRVYKTAEGGQPNTLRIIDTGETLAKAGGDPNPKPLNLMLTAKTAHRFHNASQCRPKTQEGGTDGYRYE